MLKSTAPLTPPMSDLIKATEPGKVMKAGPTRAALIRRGLVWDMEATVAVAGTLTEAGLQIRAKLLPPPAVTAVPAYEEPTVDAAEELKLAGLRTMSSEQLQWVMEVAEQDGDRVNMALIRQVMDERMEAPAPTRQAEAHSVEANSEGYFTRGCGADIRETTRQLVEQDAEAAEELNNWAAENAALPHRVPGVALTEELTGQAAPAQGAPEPADIGAVPVGTARPGYRPSVLLRPVSEVVERASRETFLAVGSEWGHLEGRRVRIACMDGDVFHQRPLMLVEGPAGPDLNWVKPEDKTVHMPRALYVGSTVLVDGCRVYQVAAPRTTETPRLFPVR